MSSNRLLDEMEDFIKQKIETERWTHHRLSVYLKQRFPAIRGLSTRSLQRLVVLMHLSTLSPTTPLPGLLGELVGRWGFGRSKNQILHS